MYLWSNCSRQHCLLKTGPKQFCALVPFKGAAEVIDMSINYTSLEDFGTLQRAFVIYTSLCAVLAPGHTADARDWGRGDEDSISSQSCSLKAFICVALCRQVQLICSCSELANSYLISQQDQLTHAQQLISNGCSVFS